MPRYFFTVRNGSVIADQRGTELPDEEAALREALRYAAELMSRPGDEIWAGGVWHIDVSTNDGPVLLSVEFSAQIQRKPPS